MAFYDQELAKLSARVSNLEKEYGVEADAALAPHADLAQHVTVTPATTVNATPAPNSVAPGIPVPNLPTRDETAELPGKITNTGDFSTQGPSQVGTVGTVVTDEQPIDASLRPEDGEPADQTVVASTEKDSE